MCGHGAGNVQEALLHEGAFLGIRQRDHRRGTRSRRTTGLSTRALSGPCHAGAQPLAASLATVAVPEPRINMSCLARHGRRQILHHSDYIG